MSFLGLNNFWKTLLAQSECIYYFARLFGIDFTSCFWVDYSQMRGFITCNFGSFNAALLQQKHVWFQTSSQPWKLLTEEEWHHSWGGAPDTKKWSYQEGPGTLQRNDLWGRILSYAWKVKTKTLPKYRFSVVYATTLSSNAAKVYLFTKKCHFLWAR